jgi:hypothetical protein
VTSGADTGNHRQQGLYWQEVVQLKVQCEYMRRYRVALDRRATAVSTVRAIAASGAIATWAVVQAYPLVWGAIIAAAQVTDALRDVFPFAAHAQSAADLTDAPDKLFIEAIIEWETILTGRLSDGEISKRRGKLMDRRRQVVVKFFPKKNLRSRQDFLSMADRDAKVYFTLFAEAGSGT